MLEELYVHVEGVVQFCKFFEGLFDSFDDHLHLRMPDINHVVKPPILRESFVDDIFFA